jgi:hypothetical protein
MLSDKQKATNYETLKHIEMVMQLLATMQHEIARRMFSHDRSKLESPEMEMFEQFTDRLAGMTYGSEEYKYCLEEMKQTALGHHYENNRHHVEYFPDLPKDPKAVALCESVLTGLRQIKTSYPDDEYAFGYAIDLIEGHKRSLESSVNHMNLIDVLEMVCDWKAATLRHNDGDIHKSVEINTERFGLSAQLVNIILNTIPLLRSVYGGVVSQKDLDV